MKDADLAQVADLMSYSVQTVDADARITDLIQRIRRMGHEGYPVVDNGQIVGLLTLRDADKTLEHGLHDATVRDVMLGGTVTLHPDDPVWLLATTMAGSDWGQIPVVDEQTRLIGIVTRTDLIKFWAQTYLAAPTISPQLDLITAQRILGTEHITLIERIAQFAQEQDIFVYMVGGVVRDLILER